MEVKIGIDMMEFIREFREIYHFLYENVEPDGYAEAVVAFDNALNNDEFAKFVMEVTKYMCDFISSDREAAAFMYALDKFKAKALEEMQFVYYAKGNT